MCRLVPPLVLCVRLRLHLVVAVLCIAPSGWASTTDERVARHGPSVLELSRQVYDRVRPALEPSGWTRAVSSFDRRMGRDFDDLVEPSMNALDTFFHDWEPVPRDKTLLIVVRDWQLVFDLVSTAEARARPRALEFVLSLRSLLGLRYSPQAFRPVGIERGGAWVMLPTGSALVDAYRDRKADDDEDPMVAKTFVLRSGVKILLGFCLGLLFWGVIRNL